MRGEVFAVRTEPALLGLRKLAPVANRLPAAISSLAMQFTPSADLAISSIPGVPYEVFMAGARIEKVYPFGPLPGVAVMAAMVSHNGTACIGLNVDATAVPDTDVFAECMAAGLSEVLGA